MNWYAIVLGGGSGARMGAGRNKVLLPVAGESMLCRSVRAFHGLMEGLVVVIRREDRAEAKTQLRAAGLLDGVTMVDGGDTRQDSVANGLRALPAGCAYVAVHDGARCLVDEGTIRRAMAGAEEHGAAVAAIPCVDTVKQVDGQGFVTATPDRSGLRAVQTPQCFSLPLLLRAHEQARQDGFLGTDDASLVEHLGQPVLLTEGSRRNLKLTVPEDIATAETWLGKEREAVLRIGQGYDVHRLVEGRDLILCGVKIPYEKGLLGHSDADVALHALMDAMLGAMALGDIGKHFPDSDERYRGISSMTLLRHVDALLREHGARVRNVDVTIVAQAPKLAAFIPAMRAQIAEALALPMDCVSVKATTTERLGFEGEGLGISAQAVCMVGREA